MFLPPYIALADVDLAVAGARDACMATGRADDPDQVGPRARRARQPVRWPVDRRPGVRPDLGAHQRGRASGVAVHLGGTDYQKYGADWSEDPEVTFGDFDAFQWVMYWGDRPAMELTVGHDPAQPLRSLPEHAASACRSRAPCGCRTRCARWTTPSSWAARRSGRDGSTERPERDLPPALRRRPLPRGERASASWPRSGSSRSCSAPTSRTARGSRTRRSTSARS